MQLLEESQVKKVEADSRVEKLEVQVKENLNAAKIRTEAYDKKTGKLEVNSFAEYSFFENLHFGKAELNPDRANESSENF